MKLDSLFENIEYEVLNGSMDIDIVDVAYNYEYVKDNYLYVSMINDGNNKIDDAINNGAIAIVIDHDIELSRDITIIKVKDVEKVLSKISMRLFKFPQNKMRTIAVTGTKGKTMVSFMIKEILEKAGYGCGLISAKGIYIKDKYYSCNNTKMYVYDVLKWMNEMVNNNVEYMIIEVSNQVLINDIIFDYGIFTNLIYDNVDLGIEDYIDNIGKLFKQCNHGIFNMDDKHFYDIVQRGDSSINTYGYDEKADLRVINFGIKMDIDGVIKTTIKVNNKERYFSYNVMATILTCYMLGIDIKYMKDVLSNFSIN